MRRALFLLGVVVTLVGCLPGQAAPAWQASIDAIAVKGLHDSGVPSASVAVVQNGRIAYVHAYGNARLDPATAARPDLRYCVGSISKQFTATAVLMLVDEGKLSLDDPVARFFSDLSRAQEVTVRQLLQHTAGYQDYWAEDYMLPDRKQSISHRDLIERWGRLPLDFDPGTQWQYSNTGFDIAGGIVEKVSGMPLFTFLQQRVFTPLHMTSVTTIDDDRLAETGPVGYMRHALGPLRPAATAGKGWAFGAGALAMTAEDLARWDIAMIDQRLLKPASYRAMQTQTMLKNGMAVPYALGINVRSQSGHRTLEHRGEWLGFTASNLVMPDDHTAIVVLTNQDAANGDSIIAHQIVPILFAQDAAALQAKEAQTRAIFEGLQQGKIDRSLLTPNANSYYTAQALQDYATSLGPLGRPQSLTLVSEGLRGGMVNRVYQVTAGGKKLNISTYVMPDGKLEQYMVEN